MRIGTGHILGFLWLISTSASAWSPQPFIAPLACKERLPAIVFEPEANYSKNNAFMGLMANVVAEMHDARLMRAQLEAWGFQKIELFGHPKEGAYAYLVDAPDFRLLAFRGTNSLEEGVKDALFAQVSYADLGFAGQGHLGMKKHFEKVSALALPELLRRITFDPKPLFLVGHSLGGVLALLQAMQLAQMGIEVQGIYTSGQPRIGNADFYEQAESLVGDRYHRIEQGGDLTPKMPPSRAAAGAFAAILPGEQYPLKAALRAVIERMDYAVPRTWKLVLRADSLDYLYEADLGDEQSFWQALSGTIRQSASLTDLAQRLNQRFSQHPAPEYLCKFTELFDQSAPRL